MFNFIIVFICTGGIERFSAKKNFRKNLKVSHFYLGFSPNKNINEIKHSQRVSSDFFRTQNLGTGMRLYMRLKNLMKLYANV